MEEQVAEVKQAEEGAVPSGQEQTPAPVLVPATAPVPADGTAPAEGTPKPKAQDWKEKRIAELTAKLAEERARNKAAAPVDGQQAAASVGQYDDAEVDRRATTRARELASQQEFTKACGDVVVSGRKDFADFDSRINEIRRLADPNDQTSVMQYNTFLAAAIETGEAPKLLHQLGGDLNEAHRIMSLPPVKMGVELAKMASRQPGEISNAPRPITPVGNKGRSHDAISPDDKDRSDSLSDAEWFRRRNEQLEKRVSR